MNIVNSGNEYMVYGEEVKTFKSLPADTYTVCFSQQKGFFLRIHNDLTVCEKIYGPYVKKVEKVMKTFESFDRNMGIILSGPKGVGKSVFGRLLAEEGKKRNLPLVIVDHAFPGVASFISSIRQECIVLFDEFEKVFDDREGQQDQLLSFFDGIDDGRKLFVVTCNSTRRLNEYLLNRPGRFHYHFTLGTPSYEDVKTYLNDNLNDKGKIYLNDVLRYHSYNGFTYDVLRAIVTELNNGYDLNETLQDLNVDKKERLAIHPKIMFNNGIVAELKDPPVYNIDVTRGEAWNIWLCIHRSSLPDWISDAVANEIRDVEITFQSEGLSCDRDGYNVDINYLSATIHADWDDLADINLTEEERRMIRELTEEATIKSFDLGALKPGGLDLGLDHRKFTYASIFGNNPSRE